MSPAARGRPVPAAWVVAGLAVAAAITLGACGGEQGGGPSGSTDGTGTAATTTGTLRPGLLPLAEARTAAVLGMDTRPQPVLDRSQFDLTTVPGPCGTPLALPFSPIEGFRVFRSTVALVVEATADAGDQAAAVLDAARADARPGCPPFPGQVADVPVTVTYLGPVALPAVGDDRFAWAQSLTGADGHVGYRYVFLARAGGRLGIFAAVFDRFDRPVDTEALAALAARAFAGP